MEIESDISCPVQLLTLILALAAIGYSGEVRKDPDSSPYINHCIETADNLRLAGILNRFVIAAAIGHDLLEVNPAIKSHPMYVALPHQVRSLIEAVTDPVCLASSSDRKAWQLEIMRNTESLDWVHLKLADRLSNCRSMSATHPTGWSRDKKTAYLHHSEQLACLAEMKGANSYLIKELMCVCRQQFKRIQSK